MRIPQWLPRIKRIFFWPMAITGGILFIGGTYLTARDFYLLLLPGWLWLTVGSGFLVTAVLSILYRLERRTDPVAVQGQTVAITSFPKLPNYNKEQKQEAKTFLDRSIRTGGELRGRIQPRSLKGFEEIQEEIAKFIQDVDIRVWELMPEYHEYFTSPLVGLDISRYDQWYQHTASECRKIDSILVKLKKMRSEL